MRIGIDGRLLSYRRGIGSFLYNLLVDLTNLDKENEYILYTTPSLLDSDLELPSNFQVHPLSVSSYLFAEQLALPLAARRDGLDVLHCPANTGPLWQPKGIKLVLTVHDVMYMLPTSVLPSSPSLYQRLGRLYRRFVVPPVARRADAIVTDSDYSRQDILQYLNVEEDKMHVVWGAPNRACRVIADKNELSKVREKYKLNRPFILALAGIDPRKNTRRVIEAFALLLEDTSTDCQLALVGLPPSAQRDFLQYAQELEVANQIVFTDFISEEDLVALYNLAQVFVYPSLYEGFGLPVLEAMACGTPVITSPRGSLPEVAGDAVLLVDPTDPQAIYQGIARILTDPDQAEQLRKQGFDRVRLFSWRRAAEEMLRVYRRVVRS